ncbi:hypothetical protein [Achromobacter aegrifaciens]|uniref:hypothetical protein n=1 Tax=Achromobacter aegrifaciens TaxID=1287736 RepID=UPI000F738A97|nr:hypothetical protein [Achromobacter aegrifaciens]RSE91431.1 hypothetical protein EGU54_30740 [Achromobacter aegrifaciens]
MTTLEQIVAGAKPGTSFTLSPEKLLLSLAEFDALVAPIVASGGGEGFEVVKDHQESMTGNDFYDRVLCIRHEE